MGCSSDIFITREQAEEIAIKKLKYQQDLLINAAVKGMENFELSHILNDTADCLYYYSIVESQDEKPT